MFNLRQLKNVVLDKFSRFIFEQVLNGFPSKCSVPVDIDNFRISSKKCQTILSLTRHRPLISQLWMILTQTHFLVRFFIIMLAKAMQRWDHNLNCFCSLKSLSKIRKLYKKVNNSPNSFPCRSYFYLLCVFRSKSATREIQPCCILP